MKEMKYVGKEIAKETKKEMGGVDNTVDSQPSSPTKSISLLSWPDKAVCDSESLSFVCFSVFYLNNFYSSITKRMVKMAKSFSNEPDRIKGTFMGFNTSESEDTETSDLESGSYYNGNTALSDKYSNVVFQGNLLDNLPNWLDRLFEGTTHRYYINYWPDFNPK
uniref:Uncharacterized protein n=1 Tax=Timema bartmani TaxID=61472 RepID=A0A7R9EZU1_9NEOP|nr:unnamed protein product [Timema bartmani]